MSDFRRHLPNLLSALRIALMPAVLLTAMAGAKQGFVVLLTGSLLTDALDGFFARRFNAESELGRKLDSFADYMTLITGIAGIALLWPGIMQRELPWVATGLVAFFAVVIYGYALLGRPLAYHTLATKVLSPILAISVGLLLADVTAKPFHWSAILLIASGLEQLAISRVLPGFVGEVPSFCHAWRKRHAKGPVGLKERRGNRD